MAYLALPIDLVPDFIPVVRQADHAIVVVIVAAWAARSGTELGVDCQDIDCKVDGFGSMQLKSSVVKKA